MQYYSLNFYLMSEGESYTWVEKAEAGNDEEAEHLLARNNSQLILSEEEFKRFFEKMAKELKIQENWTPGSLERLYPYTCADFRIEEMDEEVAYLHIRIPLSKEQAERDLEICTS